MTYKQALYWAIFWVLLAVVFDGYTYYTGGAIKALEFGNAYLMEKLLSFDNLFVFSLIFTYFGIESSQQRSILNWGILGAIVLRGLCIFSGMELISEFRYISYILGIALVYSSYSMFFANNDVVSIGNSKIIKLCKKIHCSKFLICLVAIELSDVVFAIDSIPAVIAITPDPIIAYSSNIFAILGLRSLYFIMMSFESFMKEMTYGIALVLFFIGAKMLFGDVIHITPLISLGITCGILLINLMFILLREKTCF